MFQVNQRWWAEEGGEKADANPFSEAEADAQFYLSEDEINATKLKEKGISTSDDPSTPMMPSEERLWIGEEVRKV